MTYRDAAAFDGLPVASEHDEQAALFHFAALHEWHEPRLAMLFAIPNGGARHPATGAKLKAEGVRPGVPDVMLAVPGFDVLETPGDDGLGIRAERHGLFIELKRTRGGTVSAEQRAWHDRLRRQGYRVAVCRGWTEAVAAIADYLDRPDLAEEV